MPKSGNMGVPTLDLSADTARQVVVAQGTETEYQGQPTTVLLPDGKTIYCMWTYEHGGKCGPLKRSDDGGLTWSELLDVPASWHETINCPTIYRLTAPDARARLMVFAGKGDRKRSISLWRSYSEDDGKTWSEMEPIGLSGAVMPFCTIKPIDGGKRLLALTNLRREGKTIEKSSNIIAQSISADGGLTWGAWKIILDLPELNPCEPNLVRSPDGKQLLCLLRENDKNASLYMTSDDEGGTWSQAKALPPALHGGRHMAKYAADGRLLVCFRDMGVKSPSRNHFVAWVGTYEDIINERPGQYRIKLLHNYRGRDCGYPGLELLPDETFVATTYLKYREGPERNSIVSTRFKLSGTDALVSGKKSGARH
ncbi:sialidase family protein [Geminisphaera colitermitum]|uniref:sialidase family protein n=1 Tax=Geminisphaera colitermitum TaxID=1148786 RepID=UPI0006940109|nr:sialidase family protein [Geminisphaera colitermitum]